MLLTSAGIGSRRAARALEPEAWQKGIDVNLTGCWFWDQAVGRRMVESGRGGSIVNIDSKVEIDAILKDCARAGLAVVTLCTEVPGVFELADRVVVISRVAWDVDELVVRYEDVTMPRQSSEPRSSSRASGSESAASLRDEEA